MGFYKNANAEIPQYKAGEDIEIGAAGKIVETKEKDINIQYVGSKPIYHFNCNMDHISSADPDFLKNLKADSFFDTVVSEEITQEFDHVTDKITTFFKVVSVNERFEQYKMAATRIRHACKECAFHDKCEKAPNCYIKTLKHMLGLRLADIEDAYFFEKGEVVTERVSVEHRTYTRDTYDPYGYSNCSWWGGPKSYYIDKK